MLPWITKLIGGWIPIGTKPFPEWLGKVLWALGLFIIFSIVMNHFFPDGRGSTIISSGATQIVQQGDGRDAAGVGCNMWKLYLKAGIK